MAFIPHTAADVTAMLAAIGAPSIEALFEEIRRAGARSPRRHRRNSTMQVGRLMSSAPAPAAWR
jgi:glycine dehydrogenase subunit 1